MSIQVDDLSTQHNSPHRTAHVHARERRPLALGERHGVGDGPLLVQVNLDERVLLSGHVEDTPRGRVQLVHDVLMGGGINSLGNMTMIVLYV